MFPLLFKKLLYLPRIIGEELTFAMNRLLNDIGNVPITASIVESLYPELKSGEKKVGWLERQGYIIRLKRGLYVLNPEHLDKPLSSELIANHLYSPSYVSMATALRYYGLIPEAVYMHQSMTIKHARSFQTPIGDFDYKHMAKEPFSVGVRSVQREGYAFLMASPEKALCDLIANTPKVNLRYLKDVETYLEQDIRMDMEEFYNFEGSILESYIRAGGKKADSVATVLKFLKQ